MASLTVILTPEEKKALLQLAEHEFRDPRRQGGLLLREALERRGLLAVELSTREVKEQPTQAEGRQVP